MRAVIAVLALLSVPLSASAAPIVTRGMNVNVIDFGAISSTPGQTYLGAFNVTSTDGVVSPLTVDVECAIAVAVPACPASRSLSTSYAASAIAPFAGISATSSATSEPNFQDSTARVVATGATAFVAPVSTYASWAVEGQQLRLNYTGGSSPFVVPLLMTYDIEALVENTSSPSLGSSFYRAVSTAGIAVIDSTTYSPSTTPSDAIVRQGNATASLSILLQASTGNLSLAGGSFGGTVGFSIRPNVDYWVQSGAINQVLFFGRAGGANFAGLDVSLVAAVDPIFTIDPTWIASNPELARQVSLTVVTIGNVARVPEPGTLVLLAAGLVALPLALRRRNKRVGIWR